METAPLRSVRLRSPGPSGATAPRHASLVAISHLGVHMARTDASVVRLAVAYNKLHDKHYASIGCAPCTRAIAVGEDIRAGRWWWENPETKECGLHPAKNASMSKAS